MARMPRVLIPALALVGVSFAAYTAWSAPERAPSEPPVQPPRAPYPVTVGGAALLEPADDRTLALGAPFAGLVTELHCQVGDRKKKGDPLFRLDDRALRAERLVLEAKLGEARARLARLEALPRADDLPPAEARVAAAKAVEDDRRAALVRLDRLASANPGAVPADEVERARYALETAVRQVSTATADLVRTKQGAWAPDLAEARAQVRSAEATLEENGQLLERHLVRAPSDGTVLELNARTGEYAPANGDALVLFGDVSRLRVRVDVDEESAPLVRAGSRAQAIVRGFPDRPIELRFVRVEPWVRPKRSLTGATSERVDTRVLQVLFELGETPVPVYAGQQVDVYMEAVRREDVASRGAEETRK